MQIAVVGTGYVGLVTGTCFAETGNHVVCVDIDARKVERMRAGEVPIYEPGLEMLFERNLKAGRLSFTTDLAEGIEGAEVIMLALPTPPGEDGSADLRYVLGVAEQLGPMLKGYTVIVDKSTVPVGTAALVAEHVGRAAAAEFDIVSNPEFLREGVAVDDFLKPERVIVGTSSPRAQAVMERLYAPFVRQGNPVIIMDERSAELTKYAANAFLATKITFMNEIAQICERVGADVDRVRIGLGTDTRIGKRFLFPGVGYGGSCFPKDVQALRKTSADFGYDFRILSAVMDANDVQKTHLLSGLRRYLGGSLQGKTIAIWGLAFKPNTDDIREAPALENIDALLSEGARIRAYDPEANANVSRIYGTRIEILDDAYAALDGADVLMIMTEWSEFRTPDFPRMEALLRRKAIFDGRNLYELSNMARLGWHYVSIGRGTVQGA